MHVVVSAIRLRLLDNQSRSLDARSRADSNLLTEGVILLFQQIKFYLPCYFLRACMLLIKNILQEQILIAWFGEGVDARGIILRVGVQSHQIAHFLEAHTSLGQRISRESTNLSRDTLVHGDGHLFAESWGIVLAVLNCSGLGWQQFLHNVR